MVKITQENYNGSEIRQGGSSAGATGAWAPVLKCSWISKSPFVIKNTKILSKNFTFYVKIGNILNQIEDSYPKPFAFLKLGTRPVKTLEPPLPMKSSDLAFSETIIIFTSSHTQLNKTVALL